MKISGFPDCCTSLILSNIPDFLPKKIDPLSIYSDRGLYYLFDGKSKNNHYCNIHAILTDEQINEGDAGEVLAALGFHEVNSSQKHENGGEYDTGNLHTFIADWQEFRNKLFKRFDFARPTGFRPDWTSASDYWYMPNRIKTKLPLYKAAYKYHKAASAYKLCRQILVEDILGIGGFMGFAYPSVYELLTCSDLWRKSDVKKFWTSDLSGREFYEFLGNGATSSHYKTACNALIDRYKIDLPLF